MSTQFELNVTTLPIITLDLIKTHFSEKTIARGKIYFEKDHVIRICETDEHLVAGYVSGSARLPYNCSIYLGEGSCESTCNCYVGYQCKHGVACLFAIMAAQSLYLDEKQQADNMSYRLQHWLNDLKTYKTKKNPKTAAQILHYVIQLKKNYRGVNIQVDPMIATQLKKGGFGNPKNFYPSSNKQKSKVSNVDLQLFYNLDEFADFNYGNHKQYLLCDSASKILYEQLVRTGRAVWQSYDGLKLIFDQPKCATIDWITMPDGSQKLMFFFEGKALTVIPLEQLWYIELETGHTGRLSIDGVDDELAMRLWDTPLIQPDEAQIVRNRLIELLGKESLLPLPIIYPITTKKLTQLKPTLLLHYRLVRQAKYHFESYQDLYLARLQFEYKNHPQIIYYEKQHQYIYTLQDNKIIRYERDQKQESRYLKHLKDNGLIVLKEADILDAQTQHEWTYLDSECLIAMNEQHEKVQYFMTAIIPALEAQGWEICYHDSFPVKQMIDPDKWYLHHEETSDIDWFSLDLGILVSGEKISLLPHLVKIIQNGYLKNNTTDNVMPEKYMIELPVGKSILIEHERLRHILKTLMSVYDKYDFAEKEMHLERQQLPTLANIYQAIGSDNMHWFGEEKILKAAQQLTKQSEISPVPIPHTFKTKLRDYQQQGVAWLQFLKNYHFSGILADDMGLGKTIQTLAHLLVEKQTHKINIPSLVIAPTSVIANWELEAKKFSPTLKVLLLHGQHRKKYFSSIPSYDLVLTTYPLLIRDKAALLLHHFHYVILDEAQYIKNYRAKMTQSVHQLHSAHRLCLTGTPIENNLSELWSLFHYLMPGLLGPLATFRNQFKIPIEKHDDETMKETLQKMIRPFVLRRQKAQVVAELPPKTEIIQLVDLFGKQRDLYESIRLAMHDKIKAVIQTQGVGKSQILILDALLKLRQVCCHPKLVKLNEASAINQSAKLDALLDKFDALVQADRKTLLFSQFTSMLSLIEDELKQRKIPYVKLTGKTRNRQKVIDSFQQGPAKIFLISLKAGGTGLNLTAADTVIHYDPWWNPAVESQATDRAHRIGQTHPVFVYKFIAKNSIEEKILEMQAKKRALSDLIFTGGKSSSVISVEDFEWLLS